MVSYLQLAHNERHPVSGNPVAKVIHNFGRADRVDRADGVLDDPARRHRVGARPQGRTSAVPKKQALAEQRWPDGRTGHAVRRCSRGRVNGFQQMLLHFRRAQLDGARVFCGRCPVNRKTIYAPFFEIFEQLGVNVAG